MLSLRRNFRHLGRVFHASRCIHTSSVCSKRRGATSDTKLPELIVDKPPNFYPSIRDKLARINYYDNPVNEIDIGFAEDTEHFKNFIKTSLELFDRKEAKRSDEESFENSFEEVEYEKISSVYAYSKESVEQTISLAHHYAIFRDLFFKESIRLDPASELIAKNAKNEAQFDEEKHQPKLYFFRPIVPFVAEFLKEDGEQVYGQTSYRGNLIPAEFGCNPPVVTINASNVHGKFESIDTSQASSIHLNCSSPNVFYTLALVNLDSHFNDSGVCHWLVTNICNPNGKETLFEEKVKYLPVHGIKGLGYHRYAFVLYEHHNKLERIDKIDDFDLEKRRFNGLQFMDQLNSDNQELSMKPIGLSWFQTTWNDESCRDVYYKLLNMRIPSYEYVFPKQSALFKQLHYPGRAPFNLYLDRFRDPKDLNKEVLTERLKQVDPFESYEPSKMYPDWSGKPVLPHIHPFPEGTPSWLALSLRQKRAHHGRFRGLRAASAILPYNNNADLDRPQWPRIAAEKMPLNCPNPYPDGKRRPKPMKETLWSKPLPEHHSLRVVHGDGLDEEDQKVYEKAKID